MSNTLRNKITMDYFKGIKNAVDTLTIALNYKIDGRLTESDYIHILTLVGRG